MKVISEAAAKHAGLVMAHAAVVASVLESGELICPFVVVTKGEDRESIEFEADTQDLAVERAWASLEEYRTNIDLWAMAREGLVAGPNGKEDVLVVASWDHSMSEPAIFTQRFRPRAKGSFALIGPINAPREIEHEELERVKTWLHEGISGSTPFLRTVWLRLKTPGHAGQLYDAFVDCGTVRDSRTDPHGPHRGSGMCDGLPALV